MNKIFNWLGGGPSKLIEAIGEAVDKNTTTDAERLQLRNQITKIVNEHFYQVLQLEFNNIIDARAREISLKEGPGVWMMNVAAGLFVLLFAIQIILPWLGISEPPGSGYQTATKTLEYILIAIVSYWFGSSNGSRLKDKLIPKFNADKE